MLAGGWDPGGDFREAVPAGSCTASPAPACFIAKEDGQRQGRGSQGRQLVPGLVIRGAPGFSYR